MLDQLAAEAQTGFCYPLRPGRVPSSELVHIRFFGYAEHPFPGRACLEALGHRLPIEPGDVITFLAPRHVALRSDGHYSVIGGYGEQLAYQSLWYAALNGWQDGPTGYRFNLYPIPSGEAILRISRGTATAAPVGDITDSDPFFFTELPVLRPRPLASFATSLAAQRTADALDRFLGAAAMAGAAHTGGSITHLLVSKWTGTYLQLPSFTTLTGLRGASVASSLLYAGLASLTGLHFHPLPDALAPKIDLALQLLRSDEAAFVHVHTKQADEAAHAGDPHVKVAVIEQLDRDLQQLLTIAPSDMVICITADHCTPIGGRSVHWGDSVPILIRGPFVRTDSVTQWNERSVTVGSLGQIDSADLLPFLLCQADQSHFLGARPLPFVPWGIPVTAEPWTLPANG
ncbi:MAG: hypothetical protein NVS2B7_01240 [Herpetosiphon sp.]